MVCENCLRHQVEQLSLAASSHVLPQNRVRWKGTFFREAVWPAEPDLSVIKSLALEKLPPAYHDGRDPDNLKVEFFDQGGFHKVYKAYYPDHETHYVFRVALPADPYIKTENQVANLQFIRKYTTIRVPNVITWDSSDDNPLGYEWILLEALQGVNLEIAWKDMKWEDKVDITKELCELTYQLDQISFERIGGLYLCDRLCECCSTELHRAKPILQPKHRDLVQDIKRSMKFKFYYGGLSTLSYFEEGKVHMQTGRGRGPYKSDIDWLKEKVAWKLDWVEFCLKILDSENEEDIEDLIIDENFRNESEAIKAECHDLLRVMPTIFNDGPPTDSQTSDADSDFEFALDSAKNNNAIISKNTGSFKYHLRHDYLHRRNIIVDPNTFKLKGIIDWEMACVMPEWVTTNYPELLQEEEREGETEAPKPEAFNGDKNSRAEYKEAVTRWEIKELRHIYDLELNEKEGLPPHTVRYTPLHRAKQYFEDLIDHIGTPWYDSKRQLECELLRLLSAMGNYQAVDALLSIGISANTREYGWNDSTPLHYAVKNGHRQIAEILLRHGGPVDAINHEGYTPLMIAYENGDNELIRILTKHEAAIKRASIPPSENDGDSSAPESKCSSSDEDEL